MEIWKYESLGVPGTVAINAPTGIEFLSVKEFPKEHISIWGLVDPERKSTWRHIHIVATGDLIESPDTAGWEYIGTVILSKWVAHVFDGGIADEI